MGDTEFVPLRMLLPVTPTPAMIAAAEQAHAEARRDGLDRADAAAVWGAMLSALPAIDAADMLRSLIEQRNETKGVAPADHLLIDLPKRGANWRNPTFWGDLGVRQMVIETHRQMPLKQAREAIRERFGDERTPSRSALDRAWQRLDLWKKRAGR